LRKLSPHKPPKVVLRVYGDTIILAPYNGRTVQPRVQLMDMGSNRVVEFSRKRIGPLRSPRPVKAR
jgi:hypothetical protein